MAQPDMQWPSEDEDFDAVSNDKNFAVAELDNDNHGHEDRHDHGDHHQDHHQSEQRVAPTTAVQVVSEDEPEDQPADQPEEPTEPSVEQEEVAPEDEQPPQTETAAEEEELPAEDVPEHTEQAPEQPYEEPVPTPVEQPRAKSGRASKWLRALLEVILIAAVAGLGLWAWTLYTDNKDLKKQVTQLNANPQLAIQKQTQDLIAHVGALMQLPADETPTVANVSDATKAKQQSAFFNNAQDGDKVLMYVKAGEAILYRPRTDKIVLVAPLTFSNNQAAATSTPSTTTKK
jgi:hypothetical protein